MRNVIFAGMFALAGVGGPAIAPHATAATISIRTIDGLLIDGHENAGAWKSPTAGTQLPDLNSNHITGFNNDGIARSFFSFDLSLVGSSQVVSALTLKLKRYNSNAGNEASETVEFFDVSTDPVTLNHNGTPNAGIFNDLGSGDSYGTLSFGPGASTDILSVALNANALLDINAALGAYQSNPITANRFFSIGADLITNSGNDGIFGASNLNNDPNGPRPTLVLTLQEPLLAADAPEPTTLAAFGLGVFGLSVLRRRARKS
jgi:hypothetical protein